MQLQCLCGLAMSTNPLGYASANRTVDPSKHFSNVMPSSSQLVGGGIQPFHTLKMYSETTAMIVNFVKPGSCQGNAIRSCLCCCPGPYGLFQVSYPHFVSSIGRLRASQDLHLAVLSVGVRYHALACHHVQPYSSSRFSTLVLVTA